MFFTKQLIFIALMYCTGSGSLLAQDRATYIQCVTTSLTAVQESDDPLQTMLSFFDAESNVRIATRRVGVSWDKDLTKKQQESLILVAQNILTSDRVKDLLQFDAKRIKFMRYLSKSRDPKYYSIRPKVYIYTIDIYFDRAQTNGNNIREVVGLTIRILPNTCEFINIIHHSGIELANLVQSSIPTKNSD